MWYTQTPLRLCRIALKNCYMSHSGIMAFISVLQSWHSVSHPYYIADQGQNYTKPVTTVIKDALD